VNFNLKKNQKLSFHTKLECTRNRKFNIITVAGTVPFRDNPVSILKAKQYCSQALWLTPVILVTQEVEIGRIMV
jgi:hypothetical protein